MENAPASFPPSVPGSRIILYDSRCLLCSRLIQFILKRDTKEVFRFAVLESETGLRVLSGLGFSMDKTDSVVLWMNGKGYLESTAAILILSQLGGVWKYFNLLLHIPEGWRNGIYRWVARNRYRWLGTIKICPIPEEKYRSRFFDKVD
jgi:predicted DCC family thiol-disulfide oxidoreductase YuxK